MRIPESGVHMVYGRPGAGKTYYLCRFGLSAISAGRRVVSDFSIPGAFKWDSAILEGADIYDSLIILDEGYRYFNSREYRKFSLSAHELFSLNRHNGNLLLIGTQHPARVDVVIRELADWFILIDAFRIPFVSHPIFFSARWYDADPVEFKTQLMPTPEHRDYYLFQQKIARAYDTHALRGRGKPLELQRW